MLRVSFKSQYILSKEKLSNTSTEMKMLYNITKYAFNNASFSGFRQILSSLI